MKGGMKRERRREQAKEESATLLKVACGRLSRFHPGSDKFNSSTRLSTSTLPTERHTHLRHGPLLTTQSLHTIACTHHTPYQSSVHLYDLQTLLLAHHHSRQKHTHTNTHLRVTLLTALSVTSQSSVVILSAGRKKKVATLQSQRTKMYQLQQVSSQRWYSVDTTELGRWRRRGEKMMVWWSWSKKVAANRHASSLLRGGQWSRRSKVQQQLCSSSIGGLRALTLAATWASKRASIKHSHLASNGASGASSVHSWALVVRHHHHH